MQASLWIYHESLYRIPNHRSVFIPRDMTTWQHHELTCGEEAPVGVEREAGDGGGRLQLEDVLRPVAERVAELARPHAQPSLPAPLKLLVLGRHDVHLQ